MVRQALQQDRRNRGKRFTGHRLRRRLADIGHEQIIGFDCLGNKLTYRDDRRTSVARFTRFGPRGVDHDDEASGGLGELDCELENGLGLDLGFAARRKDEYGRFARGGAMQPPRVDARVTDQERRAPM